MARRLGRAEREQQMLDAAVEVFSERGYHNAQMEAIAERAGVSKPLIYLYLGSKEDLFRACIRREGDRLTAAITGVATGDLTPREQLRAGLLAFFTFVHTNTASWAVVYVHARGLGEPLAGQVAESREAVGAAVTALLARATGDDVDREELESYAWALMGAAESVAERFGGDDPMTPEIATRRLMTLVWSGLGRAHEGLHRHPSPGQSAQELLTVE